MASEYDEHTIGPQLVHDFSTHIKDKVLLTTGISPGSIGANFVAQVAEGSPKLIILAGRNAGPADETAKRIKAANASVKTRFLKVELSSFKSVRAAAAEVNSWDDVPAIDVLVNSAGIMAVPWGKTEDGFERQFGTNHLGPFLLTNLLMKKIMASEAQRVVMVSSDGHRLNPIRWTDYNFNDGKHYNPWHAYGQSKTGNNLFAISLAEKLGSKGLQAFSLHPGVHNSNLGTNVDWSVAGDALRAVDIQMGTRMMYEDFTYKSEEKITATVIFAAFSPDLKEHNGAHLFNTHVADQYKEEVWPWGKDPVDADRLWKLSEKLVGQQFQY